MTSVDARHVTGVLLSGAGWVNGSEFTITDGAMIDTVVVTVGGESASRGVRLGVGNVGGFTFRTGEHGRRQLISGPLSTVLAVRTESW